MPAFSADREKQKEAEKEAMEKLKNELQTEEVDEICELWNEYEAAESLEAKFVKALDKLEVRIQHNEAKIDTWNEIEFPRSQFAADKYCAYDNFIREFNELVKLESRNKIENESDKNIE